MEDEDYDTGIKIVTLKTFFGVQSLLQLRTKIDYFVLMPVLRKCYCNNSL